MYPWLQYYKAEGKDWKNHLPEILDQVKEAGLDAWEQSIDSESEADRLSVLLEYRDLADRAGNAAFVSRPHTGAKQWCSGVSSHDVKC